MYNVNKKLLCRLFTLLLILVFLFIALLHWKKIQFLRRGVAVFGNIYWEKDGKNVKMIPKSVKKDSSNHSWIYSRNYCNSKKRQVGSEYVLSYALFGKNSCEKYGQYVKNAAESAAKNSLYHNWTVRLYHDLYPVELQNDLIKTYNRLKFCDVRSLVLTIFSWFEYLYH